MSNVVHRISLGLKSPLMCRDLFDRNALEHLPFCLLNLLPDVTEKKLWLCWKPIARSLMGRGTVEEWPLQGF